MIDISTNKLITPARPFIKFWEVRRMLNLSTTRDLKAFGIGIKQALIMFYLHRNGTSSQIQLARFAGSDPAAVARALATLLRQEWIEQHPNPKDRRYHEITLTKKGRVLAGKIEAVFKRLEKRFSQSLTPSESKLLTDLMDKILHEFSK